MRYRDWSISVKLIVVMVVIGVVISGAVGTISGLIAKGAIDANMREHYSSIRDIRSGAVDDFYKSIIQNANTLAGTMDVETFTSELVAYHVRREVQPDDPFPAEGAEYEQLWSIGEKIERLKKANGYYDIFIICKAHGHVMYSVERESDLGQNVRVGSLKESGLGKCWRGVVDSGEPFITDFEPYAPNEGRASQFVGAPIMIDGEFKHVFVVQVPLDQIDAIMQNNAGMGKTGETYLVGQDGKLRNNSRLQLENGNADTCLKLAADQEYVRDALGGDSDFTLKAENYEDTAVLAAFSPFDLPDSDIRWAMISEISKAEAYAPIISMVGWIAGTVVLICILVGIIALFFGRSIGNPLARLAKSCQVMAAGDFTESLVVTDSKDEIGRMLRGFSEMQENTAAMIKQVTEAATNLASSSEELSANADETGRAVQDVARTVEEVAKGSAETNRNVENVAAAVTQASSQGEEGKSFAFQTNDIMQRATASIDSTATVIGSLSDKTAQIEEFIGIITGIADQTNLLALNAAIEAARAGEAGRGFAVVAEEVRKLAEESNSAAGNITQMIHGIKAEMKVALDAMDSSKGEVSEGATMVLQTSDMLGEIVLGVGKLSEQVDAIAAIATENSAAAEEVSSTTEQQTASMEEIGASASTLAKLAQDLNGLVEQFKV